MAACDARRRVHRGQGDELADRDSDKASALFRRLLKRPRFDWARDGEGLLRSAKADHFVQPRLPHVTAVSERLAAYARRG